MKNFILFLVLLTAFSFGRMSRYPHAVQGLIPVADAFDDTVYTDIVNFRNANEIHFYIVKGVGTTGTSDITVEACDDTGATNTTAIAFRLQINTTSDTFGNDTAIAAAGFTTTAGSNHIYKIVVRKNDIIASGYSYVRVRAEENADDPVLGLILIIIPDLRFDKPVQPASFLN